MVDKSLTTKTGRKRPVIHTRTSKKTGKVSLVNPHIKKKERKCNNPLPCDGVKKKGKKQLTPEQIKERDEKRAKDKDNPPLQENPLHIVSFSGGKDSSAMLLRMIELKMPIDRILFCDTHHEFSALYKYVDRINKYTKKTIGVEIEILQPYINVRGEWKGRVRTWDDMFFGKMKSGSRVGTRRGFPVVAGDVGSQCWWSRQCKFLTMNPICKTNYRYVGFGADETSRLRSSSWKPGYTFPLADWGWKEEDARDYLVNTINPLDGKSWAEQYHLDFNRTGCTFCPYQGNEALITLAEKYPKEFAEMLLYAKKQHYGKDFASKVFRPGVGYHQMLEFKKEGERRRKEQESFKK